MKAELFQESQATPNRQIEQTAELIEEESRPWGRVSAAEKMTRGCALCSRISSPALSLAPTDCLAEAGRDVHVQ